MDVKVGQVYKCEYGRKTIILCVTRTKVNGYHYVVTNEGTSGVRLNTDFNLYTLLAEYDTWINAINSPEFKGEM